MDFYFRHYFGCALLALATVSSCTDSSSSGSNPSPANPTPAANAGQKGCLNLAATSWQSGIGTIFQTNCSSCHGNYGAYAGVSGNINSILSYIDAGTMPKGSAMAAADKASVHAWATAGMPQTDGATTTQNCTGTPTPTPTVTPYGYPTPYPTVVATGLAPTYARGVQSIMSTYCVSCHGSYASMSGVSQNYNQIMSRVMSGSMPKGGSMPSDKITILQQWGTYPNAPYGQFAP